MAKILYHVTPNENVETILKEGLLRCHGDYKSAFICLSKNAESWMQSGLALLGVDIEGMDRKLIRQWPENETDEINVWADIPPNRIKLISLRVEGERNG